MKKLILIRHAKSSWKFDVIDHDRPLNERGLDDAYLVSNSLINENLKIDAVFCSDAKRTKTTANIFSVNLKMNEDIIHFNHDLYDFQGNNLIKTIENSKNSINNLMVFGHNHAITDFVNTYGNQYIDNVPTCGVIIIEFEINTWSDLKKGNTIKTLFPRDIK